MKKTHRPLGLTLAVLVTACAATPAPEAPLVAIPSVTAPPPVAPPPPPALVVIPGAEPSPRHVDPPERRATALLRSEGKRHVLDRTEDGILLLSEERGVLGFLPRTIADEPIVWAGFVDDDAVIVATRRSLYRASTPDDALLGRFTPLDPIDPSATLFASAASVAVAAAPGAGGGYWVSNDSGAHFAAAKPPSRGAIVDLAVRRDGLVVVVTDPVPWKRGDDIGTRAYAWSTRGNGAWTRGPHVASLSAYFLSQHGDTISARVPRHADDFEETALDARGRWIEADREDDAWLARTWTSARFKPNAPTPRPGFAKPARHGEEGFLVGGIGTLAHGADGSCQGVGCLRARPLAPGVAMAAAFDDGECAASSVVTRSHRFTNLTGSPAEYTTRECDANLPVRRASTLLVRGQGVPGVARLPASCAEGRVIATSRAAFVHCSSKYRGRAALLALTGAGTFAEVVANPAENLVIAGAESASDGTTVIFANLNPWLCRIEPSPSCVALAAEGFLTARPLPGGRALVVRRPTGVGALDLEIVGEPSRGEAAPRKASGFGGPSTPKIVVREALGTTVDVEVTAAGNIRVWTTTADYRTWLRAKEPRKADAFLVRDDGALVPELVDGRAP